MGLFFPSGKGWLIYLQSANQRGCQRPLLSKQKTGESFQKHEKIWQTQLEFLTLLAEDHRRIQTSPPASIPCIHHCAKTTESSSLHAYCFPGFPGISPSAPILKSSSSHFLIWLPGLFFVWLSPPGRAAPGSARLGSSGPPRPGPGRAAAMPM